jgi:hypothetical protein
MALGYQPSMWSNAPSSLMTSVVTRTLKSAGGGGTPLGGLGKGQQFIHDLVVGRLISADVIIVEKQERAIDFPTIDLAQALAGQSDDIGQVYQPGR